MPVLSGIALKYKSYLTIETNACFLGVEYAQRSINTEVTVAMVEEDIEFI